MNSIQAMNNEGEVKIRFTDFEYHILVEVEDSGPGMSEETLSKIFDPLFTTKSRGTGLGLATVKNMIEEHQGEIDVSLNPTIFKLSLPKIHECQVLIQWLLIKLNKKHHIHNTCFIVE